MSEKRIPPGWREETGADIDEESNILIADRYEEKSIKTRQTQYILFLIIILFLGIASTGSTGTGAILLVMCCTISYLILPIVIYADYKKLQELEERKQNKANFEVLKTQEMGLASDLHREGGLANLQKALDLYSRYANNYTNPDKEIAQEKEKLLKKEIAREKEKLLDYEGAIADFKELGLHKDAKRVRQKMQDEGKVKFDQKVVHGDEITKTEIKDSVVSKSSIGAGGDDKFARLEKLTEMKEKGLIDDDEFQQMKKEILGK